MKKFSLKSLQNQMRREGIKKIETQESRLDMVQNNKNKQISNP